MKGSSALGSPDAVSFTSATRHHCPFTGPPALNGAGRRPAASHNLSTPSLGYLSGCLTNVDLVYPENTTHFQTQGVSLDPHSWLGGVSCLYLLPCLPLFDMLTCCISCLSPWWEDRVGRSGNQYLILMAKYPCASHKQNYAPKRGFCVLPGNHSAPRDKNVLCVHLHTLNACAGVCGCVNMSTCVCIFTCISFLCILILLLCSPHRGAGVSHPNSPFTPNLEFALLSARLKNREDLLCHGSFNFPCDLTQVKRVETVFSSPPH